MSKLERRVRRGRVEWVQPEGTHFITVDLDVFSRSRLTGLAEAFGDNVLVLHEGRWGSRYCASFELGDSWQLSADQEVRRFVSLIQSLPPAAQRLWRAAQSRVFDIGMQADLTPHSHRLTMSPDVIKSVADVQGRITVTIYSPESRPVSGPATRKCVAAQRGSGADGRRPGHGSRADRQ